MTLPVSGAISLNQVNVELGLSGTTSINMNQASVRTLFGVPSGAISMSNGYGKANQFSFSIASNVANGNLRTLALAAGWGGTSKLLVTINGGVYMYSGSTGSYGLTVNGAFPGGVTLTNNGFIVGMGGSGGSGGGAGYPGNPGGGGGPALTVASAITIYNNNVIGGGGGGGGGSSGNTYNGSGGSGGGGGQGVNGGPGGAGQTGFSPPGGAGSASGPGAGALSIHTNIRGGDGGTYGSGGAKANDLYNKGGFALAGGNGGGGGAAIVGNGNVTWGAFGTRYGSIA